MNKFIPITVLCSFAALSACGQPTDEDVLSQIYSLDENSPPTEIIVMKLPAISADAVTIQFGFPDNCSNLKEVGYLTGAGIPGVSKDDAMLKLRERAAAHGANLVVYEAGISHIDELASLMADPMTSMMLYQCR